MLFSFHNELNIKTKSNSYTFYNNVYPSLLTKLSNFESYNNYLSIGNGIANLETQNQFHLTNHIFTTKLYSKQMQSDINKGSLFSVLEFKIYNHEINSKYIKEVGLSDNKTNPTIFNYFSLISEETPNGIDISDTEEIVLKVTIYLLVDELKENLLTSGNNKIIEFLLGNGIGDIYLSSGTNFANNIRLARNITESQTKYLCERTASISDNSLKFSFSKALNIGEIDEILFTTENEVFARNNIKNINPLLENQTTLTPKSNYVIKLDEDIESISEITKISDSSTETNYFATKYSNSFGDKVHTPFNNLFDSTTSRFISKDGKLIFFILNNKVYCYKNNNFILEEINTRAIQSDNIFKIIAFDNFIFVISLDTPYISTYIIENNSIKNVSNDLINFEKYSSFETLQQIDICQSKNNKFMIGIILQDNTALSIYLTYNETDGFITTNYLTNSKNFNYVMAMHKNNFCDARLIYLKEGETSASCRIVTHFPDETETDIYSNLAYELTNNSTRVYTKGRAIISEKTTSPNIVIFYYPQVYQYELPLISDELQDYISNDVNYIIQKKTNNQYSIYNLVGYDTPEEFTNNISELVDTDKIIDFEFLSDTLLIFLNDNNEKIVAYNLKLDKTQVENLSEKDKSYLIKYKKYDKFGANNETVKFSFIVQVDL